MNSNIQSGLLIVWVAVLSIINSALLKHLTAVFPAVQLLFLKSLVGIIILVILNFPALDSVFHSTQRKCQLYKGLAGGVGNLLWISALKHMPLADCSALSLTSAFLTTMGGALFFGEIITWPLLVALGLGFAGATIITHPSHAILGIVALYPLGSAIMYSASSLLTKRITLMDSFTTTLFYLLGIMVLMSAPYSLYNWVPMGMHDVAIISVVGVLYLASQWALVKAYSDAHAGFIAPFKFARVPLAIGVGIIWFGESLPLFTAIGIGLIGIGYVVLIKAKNLKAYGSGR
jgi:S-adenosylmethionine uptake transporter